MNLPLAVLHPWALTLLVTALLPLFSRGAKAVPFATLSMVPGDALSRVVDVTLRAIAATAMLALVLGIAGLYRPAYEIERIGQGAQMILLVDRSRSMDQPFAGRFVNRYKGVYTSKGQTARGLLSKFVENRGADMFGMLMFSSFPIPVLDLTQKGAAVQGAIEAGNFGRGLAETNIGAGLERALQYFTDEPYTGSRIIVLVSDGAAELDRATREHVSHLMRRHRAALYWIYIRSVNSPKLVSKEDDDTRRTPERSLHEFFSEMGAPYRAYTAENPDDLERAIADVGRLQNLPIRYPDIIPKRDLSHWCFLTAWILTALLILAKAIEVRRW